MPKEIYVSVDVESDGPIPGPNSMLSFGAAAYQLADKLVDTFEANLETLPDAKPNPETMTWWATQPEAWEICRQNPRPPDEAMREFSEWLKELPGKPVCVCYPAGYDFTFIYWYLIRFAGESPFGFQALDIKTLAMAALGKSFRETSKKNMPKEWFKGLPKHTHKAVDDAVEQGALFCRIMGHLRQASW
jgi:DNA polymerase III alpha subunit (gram-positive type)